MSKFHINKHGVPSPCRAKKGNCPLGGDESHFDSLEEAQAYADKINEQQHGLLPGVNHRSEAYNRFENLAKEGDFKRIEADMIYHKAEDIEGAYNVIQGMRDENGSITATYNKINEERKEINSQLIARRKEIEKDIYENGERGDNIREINQKIEMISDKIDKVEKEIEENNSGTCPKCGEGKLVKRRGAYGTFIGCNNFPKCRHTQKEMKMDKKLLSALDAAKHKRQVEIQKIQADAKRIQAEDPESQKLTEKLKEVDKRYAIAKYANDFENPPKHPHYPNRKGTVTPIEQYYEERKAADDKIESKIGPNEIVFNSGKMKFGSNTLDADLRVDKDGNINNLYIENEANRGEIKKVVKIHNSGEGNLELENGEKITMQHITNWNMDRAVKHPPQAWKLYTSEPKGEKYEGSKEILIFNIDSSD